MDEPEKTDSGPRKFVGSLTALGFFVTVVIITPFLVIDPRRPMWQVLIIAMIGFGAGHLVSYLQSRRK